MLTLYAHGGPNPRKITIFLEEAALPYRMEIVDIYEGRHRSPEFLAVNPNGRLPVLVDSDGPDGPCTLWESGAILQYLAERNGRYLPASGGARFETLKWLHFQVAHAPYLGNAHVYRVMYRDPLPEVIKRFTIETTRIYEVLDQQLARCEHVAGDEYTIADMAWFPWIEYRDWQGQDLARFPHIGRWFKEMAKRPAVQRGSAAPWPYTECGPSTAGAKAKALIARRLVDPAFALSARPEDGVLNNLGV